jgi:hypothetical protein
MNKIFAFINCKYHIQGILDQASSTRHPRHTRHPQLDPRRAGALAHLSRQRPLPHKVPHEYQVVHALDELYLIQQPPQLLGAAVDVPHEDAAAVGAEVAGDQGVCGRDAGGGRGGCERLVHRRGQRVACWGAWCGAGWLSAAAAARGFVPPVAVPFAHSAAPRPRHCCGPLGIKRCLASSPVGTTHRMVSLSPWHRWRWPRWVFAARRGA